MLTAVAAGADSLSLCLVTGGPRQGESNPAMLLTKMVDRTNLVRCSSTAAKASTDLPSPFHVSEKFGFRPPTSLDPRVNLVAVVSSAKSVANPKS